jgi:O-antigen biosynthesis protein
MAFLRGRDYDYIIFQDWHGNGFWTARACRLAAAFRGTTIGLISHAPNQWQKAGMRTLGANPLDEASLEWTEKETIASVDVLISPSRHMIHWLRDHDYRLPERVEIWPITFEDPVVTGSPETVDRGHIIFLDDWRRVRACTYSGALRDLKGAVARMPRKVSLLVKLAEVDDKPAAAYVRELHVEFNKVEFHVETNFDYMQPVRYIRRNNGVLVIPSILDNFPLTVIECITNGFRHPDHRAPP